MTKIAVAAVALNQTPLDWSGNKERILSGALAAGDAAVVCFPELCISGYGCEDLFLAPWVRERAAKVLAELLVAPQLQTSTVYLIGLPVEHGGKIYDGVAVIQRGKLLGITCKKNLANDGIHYETRWFTPWPTGVQEDFSSITLPACPIGDVWYDFDGITLGLEICHDAWVAERHAKQLADRGVQIICNPSASHFAFGKRAVREQLVRSSSREHCEVYIYANLLGCEAGRSIYDGDQIIAASGTVRASGERLRLGDVAVTKCAVELGGIKQSGVGFFGARRHRPARGVALTSSVEADSALPNSASSNWEQATGENLLYEEFTRAISLGLFDYGRKSGALRFALSLSGGADSAACAILVDILRKRIASELSKEQLNALFSQGSQPPSTNELLTCAYQATKQSSQTTLKSAQAIADGIGVALLELDVQPLVDQYVTMAEKSLKRSASWDTDDIALQNVQSRVRSPSIWLIANLKNALLLTTANRSEIAVGYATMDGDTSGGLAPLGGIDKHFIRSWLRWMEGTGPAELGSYPCLNSVNNLAPSAELRPGGTQTDEGDLMPYDVLAALERATVRYYRSPDELVEILKSQFGNRYPDSELARWKDKFLALFYRSQWKRERYAPAFHIDDFSMDSRTWLRMPILSKGG